MAVKNLTPETRRTYGIADSEKGVVVSNVSRGSVASFAGIKQGDLIISINKKPLNSSSDFDNSLNKLKSDGKGKAMLLVSRKGSTSYVTIEIK